MLKSTTNPNTFHISNTHVDIESFSILSTNSNNASVMFLQDRRSIFSFPTSSSRYSEMFDPAIALSSAVVSVAPSLEFFFTSENELDKN